MAAQILSFTENFMASHMAKTVDVLRAFYDKYEGVPVEGWKELGLTCLVYGKPLVDRSTGSKTILSGMNVMGRASFRPVPQGGYDLYFAASNPNGVHEGAMLTWVDRMSRPRTDMEPWGKALYRFMQGYEDVREQLGEDATALLFGNDDYYAWALEDANPMQNNEIHRLGVLVPFPASKSR